MSSSCAPCQSATQPPCNPGVFPQVPAAPAFPAFLPPSGSALPVDTGGGETASPLCPAIVMPRLSQSFTAPALNAVGQLFSACAYLWAVPGCTLFFPPFGSVQIVGVSGDLITFTNINVVPGTTVQAGTILVQGPPVTQQGSTIPTVASLDRVRGFLANAEATIAGTLNTVLRWNQVGSDVLLQNTPGMLFRFNPNWNAEVLPKNVSGAAITTTPLPSPGTGLVAYYDLPNLPAANLLPSTFLVRVHIRLSDPASATSEATGLRVNHSGVSVAALNSSYSNNNEVVLPVSGNRLQLEYLKGNNRANTYARVRIIGYYF